MCVVSEAVNVWYLLGTISKCIWYRKRKEDGHHSSLEIGELQGYLADNNHPPP